MMDARVPISELSELLGVKFSDGEAHTIGGLVTDRLRRIPQQGDEVEEKGFLISVQEASM